MRRTHGFSRRARRSASLVSVARSRLLRHGATLDLGLVHTRRSRECENGRGRTMWRTQARKKEIALVFSYLGGMRWAETVVGATAIGLVLSACAADRKSVV